MLTTAPNRAPSAQRRALPQPSLDSLPEGALADKGPKHTCFDAPSLGAGRRGVERALRLDRKR
jgi:hypothetical protein